MHEEHAIPFRSRSKIHTCECMIGPKRPDMIAMGTGMEDFDVQHQPECRQATFSTV